MNTVLVRYGEIGTKSGPVRGKFENVLRQRIQDMLEETGVQHQKVSQKPGRIIIETETPEKAAETVKMAPGVKSVSPAQKTAPEIQEIKEATSKLDIGDSFGVDTNRSGNHSFDSQDVNREIGSFIEKEENAEVDLDDPETWIHIDIREENAYVYKKKIEGPGGFPVGVEGGLAALISGGIDSPVAAYEAMTRGCDVTPVYFYNRPIAAEDHLMRFKASARKLKRFHPSKQWSFYKVDMKPVNEKLMDIGRGRMLLHREVMYRVSEKIAGEQSLNGLVTGESIGQKSSQTPENLSLTSSKVSLPVFRPLASSDKNSISQKARELGTFEEAKVASACRSLSPENPATRMSEDRYEELRESVKIDELVEEAFNRVEKQKL